MGRRLRVRYQARCVSPARRLAIERGATKYKAGPNASAPPFSKSAAYVERLRLADLLAKHPAVVLLAVDFRTNADPRPANLQHFELGALGHNLAGLARHANFNLILDGDNLVTRLVGNGFRLLARALVAEPAALFCTNVNAVAAASATFLSGSLAAFCKASPASLASGPK